MGEVRHGGEPSAGDEDVIIQRIPSEMSTAIA